MPPGAPGSEPVYGFANGAYAEYAVGSPDMISSKPVTIDYLTAAALPTPGLTAMQIITRVVQPVVVTTVGPLDQAKADSRQALHALRDLASAPPRVLTCAGGHATWHRI